MKQRAMAAVFVCALAAAGLLPAGPALAADYNDDYGGGNWNSPSSWNPSDQGYPQTGDTATIDSETVTVNINLTGDDLPDEIILDGGTLALSGNSRKVDAPISVKSASTISGNATSWKWAQDLNGAISDKVIASVTYTGVLTKSGSGFVDLWADNSGFTGGWTVDGGYLRAYGDNAFGPGAITVNDDATVTIGANQTGTPPSAVTVNPGGTFHEAYHSTNWTVTLDDARWHLQKVTSTSTVVLAAGSDSEIYAPDTGSYTSVTLEGTISGPASATLHVVRGNQGGNPLTIAGDNRDLLADIELDQGPITIAHANALGTNTPGAGVVRVNSNAFPITLASDLARDMTLNGGGLAADGTRTYSGVCTLAADSVITGRADGTLIITGTVAEDGTPRKLTFDMQGNGSKDRAYIELHNPDNDWSGGTEINGYMYSQVKVTAGGALGSGTVDLNGAILYTNPASTGSCVLASVPRVNVTGGTLRLASDERIAKGLQGPIHVHEGGGLWIESAATTPTFGGAGQNVQLYDGAILDDATVLATVTPTQAQISGGNRQVYRGMRADYTGEGGFGPHATDIHAGLATINETSFTVTGTMNENTAGEGFSLWTQNARQITFNGACLNATGTVALRGLGSYRFDGTGNFDGTASKVDMDATGRVYVAASGGLASGVTLNVNNGRLQVGAPDALASSSRVNLVGGGSGGIFYLDQALTSGSVKVVGSAGVNCYVAGGLDPDVLDWSAADGAHLALLTDNITDLPTNGKVNFVLYGTGNDNFTEPIVLGDETRLTSAAGDYVGTKLNANCTLAATGSVARVATNDGTTMTLECTFDLAGKTLVVGDTAAFNTLYHRSYDDSRGTKWGDATQGGIVYVSHASSGDVGAMDVVAGTLRLHAGGQANGAEWIRVAGGAVLDLNYCGNLTATLMGEGETTGRTDNRSPIMKAGQAAGGGTIGGVSPGMSDGDVGVFSFGSAHGYVGFDQTDFGGGAIGHPRVTIDVAGSGGVAGTDHDQVVVDNRLYYLNEAELLVRLRAPSKALSLASPTRVLPGDMTIIDVTETIHNVGTQPHFAGIDWEGYDDGGDPVVAAAVGDHWSVTTGTAVSVVGEDVVLHGSAIRWTARSGNANLDDIVDVLDLARLANNFGKDAAVGDDVDWLTADFNLDGKVDVLDLAAIANNFNKSGNIGAGAAAGGGGAPVPEPGSAMVLLLGAAAVIRRRRAR